ncbi:hypothetical protein GUITHDRAFT_151776 [Guillardia theta CCMP2712]|uniref:Uncharacterized protein n=2 Tax=Guillardia theta TaxID=55529 RepID=L1JJ80_GUITC|nr:hypothetical protein GUITHDRAFT_151776 [Guillardia theta CCMP2712]EKX48556.1 hypothetical protein GUITHDRAFT_151776 [Guillardia theta CCMP2712]|mmetsp:Transcript_36593/g.114232  ORF Transcript_36593/g.114232 Transcript_36593/m.114232 type:complete len:192 (+) Transcript_36593:453-1028(+)|eukprot:XP_005835536.1 hypothetical protein GUITHDRAFT_151776 [Guillardia theta CCMP2712]
MKRKEEKLNQETSQAIKDINQELLDEAAEEELTHGPFVDSFPMMSGNYGTLMQPKTDSATIAASARGSAVTGKTPTAFLNGQPIFSDDPMDPFGGTLQNFSSKVTSTMNAGGIPATGSISLPISSNVPLQSVFRNPQPMTSQFASYNGRNPQTTALVSQVPNYQQSPQMFSRGPGLRQEVVRYSDFSGDTF